MTRSSRRFLFALALGMAALTETQAATLIVIDQADCLASVRFRREIVPQYSGKNIDSVASMKRVTVHRRWPKELSGIKPPRYTPYFILVEDGAEVGRFGGYSRPAAFWRKLDRLLAKL
jgi:hypothetical protein